MVSTHKAGVEQRKAPVLTGNCHKIVMGIATVAMSALLIAVCVSETYSTQAVIGITFVLWLLCIIGLLFETKYIQFFRPLILLASLIYFGFLSGGCSCILFYFQGFILFLVGKTAFWLSFAVITTIIVLSVVFGAVWCGWLCWLGALQEFLFQQNKWNLFQSKKAQQMLFYVQISAFVIFVSWVIFTQRPVLCGYDPFISIFRFKIFNWVGYITVPFLLLSSLFIYRPFCRICPIGLILYVIKYFPFAAKLKIIGCSHCNRCSSHCKMNAIQDEAIEKTCILCGECKKAACKSINRTLF